MASNRVEKAWESMINNIQARTGKALTEWIEIINKQPLTKTSEKVKYLKTNYGMGQGYAGLVIYQAKVAAEGRVDTPEELVAKQYNGKEQLKQIYDLLLAEVLKFGSDVEVSPKNSYVSLRRNVQFAMFTPSTRTRFDIALKLKNQDASGVLEALPTPGMCTHRIKVNSIEDINPEVISWLKLAYDMAE
ncbi:MAG: DUF5655 domain-containing protein [Candidatus Cloacimonetes bacterium]|nr:DUF5655 domain-containing protein [Candidatus Cloacimonadota bacterium]